jgi:phosphomannomutase
MGSLGSQLVYEPRELQFGTSGRRGPVVDLQDLEIYINILAELEYSQGLSSEDGGFRPGQEFYFARDLRPSSDGIAQAAVAAIEAAGMRAVNLGRIPTPALTLYGISRQCGSLMVTGSHIPFDRNGYKMNTSRGELLKEHEGPIERRVEEVRARVYGQPFASSPFDARGLFRSGHRDLSPPSDAGRKAYVARSTEFFPKDALAGLRVLAYEHSAVGRDILVEVLGALGAQVIPRDAARPSSPSTPRPSTRPSSRRSAASSRRSPGRSRPPSRRTATATARSSSASGTSRAAGGNPGSGSSGETSWEWWWRSGSGPTPSSSR